jgi:Tol biopolymer transport system component
LKIAQREGCLAAPRNFHKIDPAWAERFEFHAYKSVIAAGLTLSACYDLAIKYRKGIMKGFHIAATLLANFCLMLATSSFAQSFGKNHVQYKTFDTKYIQSEHFDIYFSANGFSLAEFTSEIAEESYRKLQTDFNYQLHDRIAIIVYNSHNDFQQTNLSLGPPEESIGGFTEFFKNRVVIPYEGDWEKFRHVIHHELTHAVLLQMIYGTGVQAILTGFARLRMPLWFIEGLAEYESRGAAGPGWDTESDMFLRDATVNNYIPEIPHLRGFLAYKGGQSVLEYLARSYGREKIGELLAKIRLSKSLEEGMHQAIGVEIEELSKSWQKFLKKEYWPDIAGRREPAETGKQMTDHIEYRNFINNSPALSPQGDLLAFLSDKSDYFDIYLMSTFDGKILAKLVSGQKSGNLEELHWLRPGISWSPDSKFIVFAAKAGAEDALHIVEVKRRKIVRTLKFGLDGVFSPAWSPRGHEIAFTGMKNGQCDLHAIDLNTGRLRKITDDVFSDLEPAFSPDGGKIAFVSDRGRCLETAVLDSSFKIWRTDFRGADIYTVDAAGVNLGGKIQQITATPYLERSPVFAPQGDKLAFVSDRSGIFNIYLHHLHHAEEYPVTNVLTGIFQLSWAGDGTQIAFVSFFNAGYDVFLLKNLPDIKAGQLTIAETAFRVRNGEQESAPPDSSASPARIDWEKEKYRNYVFGRSFMKGVLLTRPERIALHDSSFYKNVHGEYQVRDYRARFSPDIVYGNAGYSQFFGVQGQTLISLSDVLGNHRLDLYTDLFYDIHNSNYLMRYTHLSQRTDYGIGAFHNAWILASRNLGILRDRYYGMMILAERPFNAFSRLEGNLTWLGINREFVDLPELPKHRIRALIGNVSYVSDTALWGWTGPNNGVRRNLTLSFSPKIDKTNGLGFVTLRADMRRYFKFWKEYNFAVRLAAAFSEGSEPQRFFLGGMDNWLNPYFRGGLRLDRPEDIYFSSFETPLRGAYYYERTGNRFALMNLEFRFPLIRYLILGWPLPLGFQNIRGTLFTDMGAAWQGKWGRYEYFQPFKKSGSAVPELVDLAMGYGLGARANLGFLLLRWDVAWSTNLHRSSSRPLHYFSVGTEL